MPIKRNGNASKFQENISFPSSLEITILLIKNQRNSLLMACLLHLTSKNIQTSYSEPVRAF
jgi:hypothetical protein